METEQSDKEVMEQLATGADIIDQMFDSDEVEITADVLAQQELLAEELAMLDAKIPQVDRELKDLKAQRERLREDLYQSLMATKGELGRKYPNGLYIKPQVTTEYYKAAGVTDDMLFSWLRANNLGDIIKETVHFGKMNSTLRDEVDQGRELPNIFNVVNKFGVKWLGGSRAKWLAKPQEGGGTENN